LKKKKEINKVWV